MRAGLLRDALGSLAVVGIVAMIAFGLPFLDHQLPNTRSVAAGQPYQVGGGVSVLPPPATSLDVTRTRPGPDQGTAFFILGGVRVAIVVSPYRRDLSQASQRLHAKIARASSGQLIGEPGPISTTTGIAGSHGAYRSPERSGLYAVFVSDGHSVELTVSGSDSDLARLRPQLDQLIASVSFGGGP